MRKEDKKSRKSQGNIFFPYKNTIMKQVVQVDATTAYRKVLS